MRTRALTYWTTVYTSETWQVSQTVPVVLSFLFMAFLSVRDDQRLAKASSPRVWLGQMVLGVAMSLTRWASPRRLSLCRTSGRP